MTQTPKASIRLTSDMNLPCSPDSPTERAGISPWIEQHKPGQIELAWEPREEEAGPSSKGIGSDPALSRQSDWSNASDRPDRHGLGPEESSASCTSSNGLLVAEQAVQFDSTLLEVLGKVGSEEK